SKGRRGVGIELGTLVLSIQEDRLLRVRRVLPHPKRDGVEIEGLREDSLGSDFGALVGFEELEGPLSNLGLGHSPATTSSFELRDEVDAERVQQDDALCVGEESSATLVLRRKGPVFSR